MKLKIVIEADITDRRWMWKIENTHVSVYGEHSYNSEDAARTAAAKFLNKCLTDRSVWPQEFK